MTEKIIADASAEKRLFISLLTRDIPLVAAFLDLIDNSINAAVEPFSDRLQSAKDYLSIFADETIVPSTKIQLELSPSKVRVSDNASGISATVAKEHVFKFGRASGEYHESDRLSVYGIGLKRALFKLGNRIKIVSDHVDGGFELNLDVAEWEKIPGAWTLELFSRDPVPAEQTGTIIEVSELYDATSRRLDDGIFEGQLREAISRTYAFYLAKFVNVFVADQQIEGVDIELGANHTSDNFQEGEVSCAITAGIGIPDSGKFRDRSSGWFVFCNGRAVISADKSNLTGWGGAGLPIFQPKHRPFLGSVFFVSKNAELLPWTTTKATINEDSGVWQEAKRRMVSVARSVVSFLDGRYTDEGTEVPTEDLKEATGGGVNVMSASAETERKVFQAPTRPKPATLRVQYDAKVEDISAIAKYIGRSSMSGSDVGRYTFNFFLKNEVGE